MKRIIGFLLFVCLFSTVHSQPGMPGFDSLYRDFNVVYHDKQLAKETNDFFDKLRHASLSVFTIENGNYIPLLVSLQKEKNISDPLQANKMLIDSIIYRFIRKDFWSFNESLSLIKFNTALDFINRSTCDCIVKQSIGGEIPADKTNQVFEQTCGIDMLKDTTFTNKLRNLLGSASAKDRAELDNYISGYIFVNCPIATRTLLQILQEAVQHQVSFSFKNYYTEIGELVTKAYGQKNHFLLSKIFPEYKKFSAGLGKAYANSTPIRHNYDQEVKTLENGAATIIQTFYVYDREKNKATLKYQVIYTTDSKNLGSKITSYTFIPLEKIADKQRLLKKLDDFEIEPPPPQEIRQQ